MNNNRTVTRKDFTWYKCKCLAKNVENYDTYRRYKETQERIWVYRIE